jgi:hypothetical protein
MREVIEGVWIKPVFHGFDPLFVCDLDISDWSAEGSAKRLDDLVHGWNHTNQFIRPSGWHAGIGKKRGGYARHILSAHQWENGAPLCPW